MFQNSPLSSAYPSENSHYPESNDVSKRRPYTHHLNPVGINFDDPNSAISNNYDLDMYAKTQEDYDEEYVLEQTYYKRFYNKNGYPSVPLGPASNSKSKTKQKKQKVVRSRIMSTPTNPSVQVTRPRYPSEQVYQVQPDNNRKLATQSLTHVNCNGNFPTTTTGYGYDRYNDCARSLQSLSQPASHKVLSAPNFPKMDGLIDQEYVDPEWPNDDPEYNIFATYGFNKLSDETVKKFIADANVVDPAAIKIINKEFTVIYDYSYRVWLEQRVINQKSTSDSHSSSKKQPINATPKIEAHEISLRTANKWEFQIPTPELFKETCKSVPLFHSITDCEKCGGQGETHCDKCNSTGFMTCPQCRGIGFGRSIAGMSHSMGHNCRHETGHCNRCHATKTVTCNACNLKGGDRKCKKCSGKGTKRTDISLKATWLTHDDRVCVGRHTRTLRKEDISEAYGVVVQEWSKEPLVLDVCPDRPDLVDLSVNNCMRIATQVPGRIREQQHQLKAVPLCAATVEVLTEEFRYIQQVFVLGSINCKLILGKRVSLNMPIVDSKKSGKGWSKVRKTFTVTKSK